MIAALVAMLSVLLCTLGYTLNSAIATVWPGAIFQTLVSVAFGAWGVLATVVAAMLTNLINVQTASSVIILIPANFIQSFIPAYYYRRLLKKGGWNKTSFRFLPFAFYGVILPNLLGAFFGALALHLNGDADFLSAFFKWLLANIPIALLLGWPLLRYVLPSFVEEGWAVKGWWK